MNLSTREIQDIIDLLEDGVRTFEEAAYESCRSWRQANLDREARRVETAILVARLKTVLQEHDP